MTDLAQPRPQMGTQTPSSGGMLRPARLIVLREWLQHKTYPVLFILCLLISMSAYLTLDSLQVGVDEFISRNQLELVGGDIVLSSRRPFPDSVESIVASHPENRMVREYQFGAIIYTDDDSVLGSLKASSAPYPLYGELVLGSGRDARSVWTPGTVLVEPQVLAQLEISLGDEVQIGEASFIVADTIASEPDRPLTGFGFGARVMMKYEDVAATQLLGQKSRIYYRIELKSDESEIKPLFEELSLAVADTRVNLSSSDGANTAVSAVSADFLTFLKLLVIAVIVLSGIGLMSVVSAFLTRQTRSIAIRRALGETTDSIKRGYRWLFSVTALLAIALATGLSIALLTWGLDVFRAIMPQNIEFGIQPLSLLKTVVIAWGITRLMTYWTLEKLHDIKPLAVLHQHDVKPARGRSRFGWLTVAIAVFAGLIYLEIGSVLATALIMLGLMAVWLLMYAVIRLVLWGIRRLLPKQWQIRLALQNIFRKNNQSALFLTTMSLTVMVLGSITMIDHSIQDQLITNFPDDAPNMFLLDIQQDQKSELTELVEERATAPMTYYPVVRARIASVNGVGVDTLKEQLGSYDNVTRIFNLSYADEITEGEFYVDNAETGELFAADRDGRVPVSILASFAEFLDVGVGDNVSFDIQGVQMDTWISSVRMRESRGPRPFFYFLFQPEVLAEAPQINFAALKLADGIREQTQIDIARRWPGITTIDAAVIAAKIKAYVDQIRQLIQLFTALSLIAGLLILLASLVSTSQDRQRESNYYRLMGMLRSDLTRISLIEFLFMGFIGFAIGFGLSSLISWVVVGQWFNMSFIMPWSMMAASLGLFMLTMVVISLWYSRTVLVSKPMAFIRTEV